MYKLLKLKFLFSLFFIALSGEARWANLEEVTSETLYYNVNINIKSDGSAEEIVEFSELVKKEAARDKASHYSFTYNEGISEIKIIEAYTISNNVRYPVKSGMIEDKPLASAPYGFDQERQILISFPNIEIGSKIYLKYSEKRKSILDNFYGSSRWFGVNSYWLSSEVNITSEFPLKIYINDPKSSLKFKASKNGKELQTVQNSLLLIKDKNNKYNLNVSLIKPVSHDVVPNSEIGYIPCTEYTWFVASTAKKWEDLVPKLAPSYEKVLAEPLPAIFEEIRNKAKAIENEIDQINLITSLINDKIQYMGDFRTVKGKFFPRNLKEIADSKIGDCKDFSVATAAILRKLNYKVQVALVYRGINNPLPYNLKKDLPPTLNDFNHAFLKVTSSGGNIYWIDPTNIASMAQGIFSDIADKMAIILDVNEPNLEVTPNINPKNSQIIYNTEIEIKNDNRIHVNATLNLKGEEAQAYTAIGLYHPEEAIKDRIYFTLSGHHLEESQKKGIKLPDLTSRIAKDLTFECQYEKNSGLIMTNLGLAILKDYHWINSIIYYVPNQLSDLYIGPPVTMKERFVILNNKVKNLQWLNYAKDTKWVTLKRSAMVKGNDIYIDTECIVKTDKILSSELNSAEYQNLRKDLLQYFSGFAIILEP